MQAVRIRVTGAVQGVGFRAFVVREAAASGLTGWVRNHPDGSVESEAFGPRGALQRFVAAVRRGPGDARVERAEAQWFESTVAPTGFRVTG